MIGGGGDKKDKASWMCSDCTGESKKKGKKQIHNFLGVLSACGLGKYHSKI